MEKKTTEVATKQVHILQRDDVKAKFQEMLGKKAVGFITSVLSTVNSNDKLKTADQNSIYMCAMMAASLDLPINPNLGFAYLIPYNQKQPDGSYKSVCQFQIGWKGFVQLAQRSGQFKTISCAPIYEGQLIEENPLTGFVFDFKAKKSNKIIGYASYFSLINGFEKTLYMTIEEATAHGKRFSQTFSKGFGLWKDDFDSMALKTVIKLLLSKYAPMTVDMQKAQITDQSVINDYETQDVEYVDNETVQIDKTIERVQLMIEDCKTVDDLMNVEKLATTPELKELYNNKKALIAP